MAPSTQVPGCVVATLSWEKEELFGNVQAEIDNIKSNKEVIVTGDLTVKLELQEWDMNKQLDIKELEKVMQKVNALWTSVWMEFNKRNIWQAVTDRPVPIFK